MIRSVECKQSPQLFYFLGNQFYYNASLSGMTLIGHVSLDVSGERDCFELQDRLPGVAPTQTHSK